MGREILSHVEKQTEGEPIGKSFKLVIFTPVNNIVSIEFVRGNNDCISIINYGERDGKFRLLVTRNDSTYYT